MLKEIERRAAICYLTLVIALFIVVLRVVTVALGTENSVAANGTALKRIPLSRQRGSFFDCNMKPITNNKVKYVSLVTDLSSAAQTLQLYFNNEETADILSRLKLEKLPVIYSDMDISGKGVVS